MDSYVTIWSKTCYSDYIHFAKKLDCRLLNREDIKQKKPHPSFCKTTNGSSPDSIYNWSNNITHYSPNRGGTMTLPIFSISSR